MNLGFPPSMVQARGRDRDAGPVVLQSPRSRQGPGGPSQRPPTKEKRVSAIGLRPDYGKRRRRPAGLSRAIWTARREAERTR